MEEATLMGSLIGELEAREAAARARVEALEEELARLTARLEDEREAWSRLRIARETVAEVIMDLDGSGATAPVAGGAEPENPLHPGVRVVGAITVPHWRQGLSAAVLPDVYRDIIEPWRRTSTTCSVTRTTSLSASDSPAPSSRPPMAR
ncbi:hypothetical protein ABT127_26055 [Streptomyces sp. NPDC001904]|uniref:hypothetical protein n=1 Tax=Streptomyces sp. NPDC001904 TaxID=3154531 RepID=UPI003320404E